MAKTGSTKRLAWKACDEYVAGWCGAEVGSGYIIKPNAWIVDMLHQAMYCRLLVTIKDVYMIHLQML